MVDNQRTAYDCIKSWANLGTLDCFRSQEVHDPGTIQQPVLLGVHQKKRINTLTDPSVGFTLKTNNIPYDS